MALTTPSFQLRLGLPPDEAVGPLVAGKVLALSTKAQDTWDFGTDGSAANMQGIQSLYINNRQNAKVLLITFMGALFEVPIPANSCAIIPSLAPVNQFGFMASFLGGGTGSDVQACVFNVPQPFMVWKAQ